MQSNQSGYFYNTSPCTRRRRSLEWRKLLEKPFCLVFSSERRNPLAHRRSYKYNAGEEIRTGNPESSDISTWEIPKLPVGERGTDLGRDRVRSILQCQPPMDAKGRKTWWKEIPGIRVQNQTHGFSPRPQRYRQAPTHKCQKHRCMAERTSYYSFSYSIICYGILGFLMRMLQSFSPKPPELPW